MPKFEEIAHEGRCDVCGKQTVSANDKMKENAEEKM